MAKRTINLTKLSGPKLRALIDKREVERGAASDAMIAAGMGMMRHYEIIEVASGNALLEKTNIARRYLQTRGAWQEALEELDARKRYHGGDKPIKRA